MVADDFGYTFDPCAYSDHDLVSVKCNCMQTFDHEPGLQKFNSSLTQEDDYTRLAVEQVSSRLETSKRKISRLENLVRHL